MASDTSSAWITGLLYFAGILLTRIWSYFENRATARKSAQTATKVEAVAAKVDTVAVKIDAQTVAMDGKLSTALNTVADVTHELAAKNPGNTYMRNKADLARIEADQHAKGIADATAALNSTAPATEK
jgi:sulfate adenylyltransferase subunit 1 (EFTu-like GTPase family)